MKKALTGIRILDFSRAVAGPYGSLLLADLGAEVIKIEQLPSETKDREAALDADWAMLFGYPVSEEGRDTPEGKGKWAQGMSHFQSLNRNKKRLALNMETGKGMEVFQDLVKKSDVVYDNFRPSFPKKLGIDFDTLKKVNPKIICCSLSGFGETGPWKDAPAYDVVLQALGGEMSMTGMPGMPPCRSGLAIADLTGGTFAALGILAAVRERDQTGVGQRVDMSMLDIQFSLLNYRVGQYSAMGKLTGPVGSGHSGGGYIPYGAYETRDGKYTVIVAGSSKHWRRFTRAIEMPELADDPKFNTNAKRQENLEAVTGIIEGVLLTKTAKEWEKIFFDAGVPVGTVNNVPEAMAHPQLIARNMVVSIEQPTGEAFNFAGNAVKIRGNTETYTLPLALGGNTREILSNIIGYSNEYIDELQKMNVVWAPPG